jgi:hypothetical protein
MIRSVRLYQPSITIGALKDFLQEAVKIGASDDDRVTIRVAPSSNHPTDPGGEITVEITTEHP